jgi:ubiquinol oxidase
MTIDLEKEHRETLERPRYSYSLTARVFFGMMDLLTGRRTTLAKAKLIEMLASIPYRSWEIRQYARMTRLYRNGAAVDRSRAIMEWGREAQDNEYWHLLVIEEKMREEGVRDPWYLFPPIPWLLVTGYVLLTRLMALGDIRRAFLFNAEFEDHAEHVYAAFVTDHPEWENQSVESPLVARYGDFENWADVFRRIGLDERDHMNASFAFCGMREHVVHYEGMPHLPGNR